MGERERDGGTERTREERERGEVEGETDGHADRQAGRQTDRFLLERSRHFFSKFRSAVTLLTPLPVGNGR